MNSANNSQFKLGFIPGFACRGMIFDSLLPHFPRSLVVDWDLEVLPSLKSMSQLVEWVWHTYGVELADCDALVGHSLGGGVAFDLSFRSDFNKTPVILLDYFLTTPPEFFRNYCAESTAPEIQQAIQTMINEARPYFCATMPQTTEPYSCERLAKREAANQVRLAAIYGMRSENDPAIVDQHLELPEGLQGLLERHFLPASAHFGMLEQPTQLSQLLRTILEQSVSLH